MKEVAEQNGDAVISNFSNNSLETQISQIQSMMQRGIKVLILNQINSKAFAPIVNQAHQQGIKVIAYDEDVAGANVDYLISRDNVEMGKVQAQSMLDRLPTDRVAKVAIIGGDPATLRQVAMSQSYDSMVLNNPKINIVYDNTTPGWDQAAAQRNAEAALQKDPNIDAFLVMWDNGAQAVAQAVKAAGKQPGTVWSTGSDASQASLGVHRPGLAGPVDLDRVRHAGDRRHEHRSRLRDGAGPSRAGLNHRLRSAGQEPPAVLGHQGQHV